MRSFFDPDMGFFGVMSALISGAWDFFTELYIPGLPNVTFASVFVVFFLGSLGIRLVFYAMDLPSGGDSLRTSSTNKPKISKERKHDEF